MRSAKFNNCNICVISPDLSGYSETFIRAHIEHLPANIQCLYGGFFPLWAKDGKNLLPGFPTRCNLAFARLTGMDPERVHNRMYDWYPPRVREAVLRRYLK